MASSKPTRVVVLLGGSSAEREVSLSSGAASSQALKTAGYDVIELDAAKDLAERLVELQPDVVFNALHGRRGEDGQVQGVLEWLGLPYTHSGVLASALAMDKEKTKTVYRAAGLPVASSRLVTRAEIARSHPMQPPYVIKPYNEGSSVGIYIVGEDANGPPLIAEDMPDDLMVEAYIPGRELTVAVMGDRALCVTEIITDGWYDYHAKYAPGGSRHVCPAEIPGDIRDACLSMAVTAHDALGCRGLSRTDFRWDDRQGVAGLFLLETNTQPGFTATSLAPEQAANVGISFPELCTWLVEDASCSR